MSTFTFECDWENNIKENSESTDEVINMRARDICICGIIIQMLVACRGEEEESWDPESQSDSLLHLHFSCCNWVVAGAQNQIY